MLLNPDGGVAAMYGAPAPGPTLLPDPVAVAFDGAGLVYVLDQERSRVLVFDRAGKIIRTIGSRGTGPGKLLAPSALAVSPGGTLYVADTGNGRIVRFTTSARTSAPSGASGRSAGSRSRPTAAASTAPTRRTNRITVSTATGGDLAEIGATGSSSGELRSPGGHRRRRGRERVGRRSRQRPRAGVLARTARCSAASASAAWAPGQFVEPVGIAVDCHGLVTVADSDNNRVQQFQVAPASACAALPAVAEPAGPDPLQPAGPAAAGAVGDADAHQRPPRASASSRCG